MASCYLLLQSDMVFSFHDGLVYLNRCFGPQHIRDGTQCCELGNENKIGSCSRVLCFVYGSWRGERDMPNLAITRKDIVSTNRGSDAQCTKTRGIMWYLCLGGIGEGFEGWNCILGIEDV